MTYTVPFRPGITHTDERHDNGVLVRRWYEHGKFIDAHIFNRTGWRDTIVKTERGIRNAVERVGKL